MKLRVAYAKCRYKDKVYTTPLVVTSYRDERGTARNKTVASLAGLPEHVVHAVESALEEQVALHEVAYWGSVSVGPVCVVMTALEQHREGMLQALFARNPAPGDLYLYDITSSYIEGETCPLAAYGYNRDRETRLRLLALTEQKLERLRTNVAAGRVKKKDVIVRRLYRWLNRWGMERFFAVTCGEGVFTYARRDEEIERYARLDGCYVIRSNVAAAQQTTEDLRDRYKDLKYVEQTFRTMKTTGIQTRPIRHFNEPQVRGHLFACFLAYRVIWELRQRLAPVLARAPETKRCEAGSLAEIWRELAGITVAKLEIHGKTHLKLSSITPYAKKLLALCQVPSLETLLSE